MKQAFVVGDKAVYPVHGVAEVVALEKRDIGGNATPVYILKILETGLKIMVPTINAVMRFAVLEDHGHHRHVR